MTKVRRFALLSVILGVTPIAAQTAPDTSRVSTPPPAPATKLEAFRPAAGSVMTTGYNELGRVADVSVDAREIHDSKGGVVRGLVVTVTPSVYRSQISFVDEEEIPELTAGIDALIAVTANPTKFKKFSVSYETRGELTLRVRTPGIVTNWGDIVLDVTAGRSPLTATSRDMPLSDLKKLKVMVDSGAAILKKLSSR